MHYGGMGLLPSGLFPMGGMGPGAKSSWFELAKKLAPDLQGWPMPQLLRETVEGLSLCMPQSTARQLWLRCKVADQCEDSVLPVLPPPCL